MRYANPAKSEQRRRKKEKCASKRAEIGSERETTKK